MDNKKVTPQELNDEALEGATGGAMLLPDDGIRTCDKCGKTNLEVKVTRYSGGYYCDDCYKNLYNKTETN